MVERVAASIPDQKLSYARALLVLTAFVPLVGLVAILGYAIRTPNVAEFASVASVGMMIAGACGLTGGLLGFLFGIPRTLQQEPPSGASGQATNPAGSTSQEPGYQANTNLEQISDWLTKILVGVGLTQLSSIPGNLKDVADYLAPGLGTASTNSTLALALLLYFLISGFLLGFLWTRLFLLGAFRQADLGALGVRIKQVTSELDALNKQAARDAAALSLVNRELSGSAGAEGVTQEQLNEAIRGASPPVRAQIFWQATKMRSENWKENKPLMERTIPVFRALVASDAQGAFHRNHGQLGYALKDQREPAWAEAEAELSAAIKIRGRSEQNDFVLYEFNRALCRINLDPAFKQGGSSSQEVRKQIVDDLRAAVQGDADVKGIMAEDPAAAIIKSWMQRNSVTLEQLGQPAGEMVGADTSADSAAPAPPGR